MSEASQTASPFDFTNVVSDSGMVANLLEPGDAHARKLLGLFIAVGAVYGTYKLANWVRKISPTIAAVIDGVEQAAEAQVVTAA